MTRVSFTSLAVCNAVHSLISEWSSTMPIHYKLKLDFVSVEISRTKGKSDSNESDLGLNLGYLGGQFNFKIKAGTEILCP